MILLVNPRATRWRYRVPLSILSIGASLEGAFPYYILDGNLEGSPQAAADRIIVQKRIRYVGITVMPGPQLREAILLSKHLRKKFPDVVIIWGGYFPSLHPGVVLTSGYVDYVIRDQGDASFRELVEALEHSGSLERIHGLSYVDGTVRHNTRQALLDPNTLTALPYHMVDLSRYIGRTYLGTRTVNYHSSVGCPFLCGFCAVAASYRARWIGLEPGRIIADLQWFRKAYGVNAVEFHDNNFFTSEERTREFALGMQGRGITWWGEARPDTLLRYSDRTWRAMQQGGCRMIFMGAESSSQHVLDFMAKGGTQTPDTVLDLARRIRAYNIVPEFSFVLGSPTNSVGDDIEKDIRYIRQVKRINPDAEIVIYVYSPVHFEDAELFQAAKEHDFAYPRTLDEWLRPEWQLHDLRKTPVTPWLTRQNVARIRNFEKVLNARFPTKSDLKLSAFGRRIMETLGDLRYRLAWYAAPLEIRALQYALKYRQPEIEGF